MISLQIAVKISTLSKTGQKSGVIVKLGVSARKSDGFAQSNDNRFREVTDIANVLYTRVIFNGFQGLQLNSFIHEPKKGYTKKEIKP